jgi:hypothetical protein
MGITKGWLFQDDNQLPRKMYSFRKVFFGHLLAICEQNPSLFESDTDILSDFGLACQQDEALPHMQQMPMFPGQISNG